MHFNKFNLNFADPFNLYQGHTRENQFENSLMADAPTNLVLNSPLVMRLFCWLCYFTLESRLATLNV
jgi:hypothetical protein